jgi:hypothetical protein
MMITIDTIKHVFSAVNTAKAVAQYFGLIESLGVKVDKLASAKLETALRELRHARNANSTKEQKSSLRAARTYFSEALSLEKKDDRKALAFLGLGMCFAQLGEEKNSLNTLIEFTSQPFDKQSLQETQILIAYELLDQTRPGNDKIPSHIVTEKENEKGELTIAVEWQ